MTGPMDDTTDSAPIVSVIIPVFNGEDHVADTLQSVLSQSFQAYEVIIVDDGSTDETANIIAAYAREVNSIHQRRIRYFYQKNAGSSAARNRGIKEAKGEWLAFLDADDLWLPDTLKKLTDFMCRHADVYLVFGDSGSFDIDGASFASAFKKFGTPHATDQGILKNAFCQLLERNFILTGTALLRKEVFEKTYPFDPRFRYGEDYDLWTRISLFYSIGCINDIVMHRRMHRHNLSRNNEVCFYFSRVFSLLKTRREYGNLISMKNIRIHKNILKILWRILYFYYIKKDFSGIPEKIRLIYFLACNYFLAGRKPHGISMLSCKSEKEFIRS